MTTWFMVVPSPPDTISNLARKSTFVDVSSDSKSDSTSRHRQYPTAALRRIHRVVSPTSPFPATSSKRFNSRDCREWLPKTAPRASKAFKAGLQRCTQPPVVQQQLPPAKKVWYWDIGLEWFFCWRVIMVTGHLVTMSFLNRNTEYSKRPLARRTSWRTSTQTISIQTTTTTPGLTRGPYTQPPLVLPLVTTAQRWSTRISKPNRSMGGSNSINRTPSGVNPPRHTPRKICGSPSEVGRGCFTYQVG